VNVVAPGKHAAACCTQPLGDVAGAWVGTRAGLGVAVPATLVTPMEAVATVARQSTQLCRLGEDNVVCTRGDSARATGDKLTCRSTTVDDLAGITSRLGDAWGDSDDESVGARC